MTLQFSIFGYLIMIVFYAISAGLLMLLWYPMRNWHGWKFIIVPLALILLILPWADEVYIAWRFHDLCKDAGVHIYRKEVANGFVDDISPRSRIGLKPGLLYNDQKRLEEFDKAGFRYKEYMLKDGGVWHVERYSDGVYATILDNPTARYHYKYSANNEDMGLQLEKQEWVIVDSESGEILGRDTTFKRYPGWIEGLWVRFLGVYPTICRGPLNEPKKQIRLGQIYKYVLIPKN